MARHARAGSRRGAQLGGPFDLGDGGPGGWVILYAPELHLGTEPGVVVPDWAGWRRSRMPRVPLDAAFLALAPDWICELLSASTGSIVARRRESARRTVRRPRALARSPLGGVSSHVGDEPPIWAGSTANVGGTPITRKSPPPRWRVLPSMSGPSTATAKVSLTRPTSPCPTTPRASSTSMCGLGRPR